MTERQVLGNLGAVVQLKDRTYLAIKRAIIDGLLEPGDALVEAEIAEQMGVSKTPVREALLRLEGEGFVERVPHTATFVRGISLEDMLVFVYHHQRATRGALWKAALGA